MIESKQLQQVRKSPVLLALQKKARVSVLQDGGGLDDAVHLPLKLLAEAHLQAAGTPSTRKLRCARV